MQGVTRLFSCKKEDEEFMEESSESSKDDIGEKYVNATGFKLNNSVLNAIFPTSLSEDVMVSTPSFFVNSN